MRFFKPAVPDADLPGLESLEDSERARVLELGRIVNIPGRWSPIRGREPADEAYLVLEGTMRVDDNGGHLADIGSGGLAGEMGLVDRRLRNARVTTTGDVVALAFPRKDFDALRQEVPRFDDVVRRSTDLRRAENDDSR